MTPILNLALRAARQVNEYIVQTIDKRDPSAADSSADQKMLDHLESTLFNVLFDSLKRGYPNHYLAEPGEMLSEVKEDSWHIHGFENVVGYARRLPNCSYTITHRHQGKVQHVIICNPFTNDEYTATRGSGAALNGRRIRCNPLRAFNSSFIASDLVDVMSAKGASFARTDFLSTLSANTGAIMSGANSDLNLAMVAAGQADAAILLDSQPAHLDGALLLCQEAGALAGTLGGELIHANTKTVNLVVANPKLYKNIVQRFGGHDKKLSEQ